MQNERNVLTTERFEEPQQSDVFVPCPTAWNVSAAARPLCLWIQSVRELGKKHRGVPTPTPRSRGETTMSMSEQHIHVKPLSKHTHIYCTRKDALNQNTVLSYWCAFQWKISSFPPQHTNSQFKRFHRWSIFHLHFHS